jgi:hypothetical protein
MAWGNRSMWQQAPQRETRVVSRETEVSIPNLEALSIAGFLGVTLTGTLWWGRFWRADALAFLVALLVCVFWWFKGPDIASLLVRPRQTGVWWTDYLNLMGFVVTVELLPPACILAFWYAIVRHMLDYWYETMPFWSDAMLAFSVAFVAATAVVVWFHANNVWNPNWPAPRWYEDRDTPEPYTINREPVWLNGPRSQAARMLAGPAEEKEPPVIHQTCGVDNRDLKLFVELLPVKGLSKTGWVEDKGTQLATRRISQHAHWREMIEPLVRYGIVAELQPNVPTELMEEYVLPSGKPNVYGIKQRLGLEPVGVTIKNPD